jgi:hypothetical protein
MKGCFGKYVDLGDKSLIGRKINGPKKDWIVPEDTNRLVHSIFIARKKGSIIWMNVKNAAKYRTRHLFWDS